MALWLSYLILLTTTSEWHASSLFREDTEDPQNTARAVHLHVPLLVCLLDRYKYLFKYGRLCQWKADLNLIQWTQTKTRPQHRQCRVQLYIEEVPRFHNIRNQSKQWRYRLGGYDLSFIYDNTSMSNNLQVNCKGSTFYCVFLSWYLKSLFWCQFLLFLLESLLCRMPHRYPSVHPRYVCDQLIYGQIFST